MTSGFSHTLCWCITRLATWTIYLTIELAQFLLPLLLVNWVKTFLHTCTLNRHLHPYNTHLDSIHIHSRGKIVWFRVLISWTMNHCTPCRTCQQRQCITWHCPILQLQHENIIIIIIYKDNLVALWRAKSKSLKFQNKGLNITTQNFTFLTSLVDVLRLMMSSPPPSYCVFV